MSAVEFDKLRELLIADRTVRKFDNSRRVTTQDLEKLVELARYCPSGRNAQPLRYALVTDEEKCAAIYPHLKWAGYYTDWDGPEPSERPVAYLIQCLDTTITKNPLCDPGLQLEAISLGMTSLGLGGCIIKSFNKLEIARVLDLDERYDIEYVLAIGYPAETVRLEDMDGTPEANYKYYRTPDGIHHVPKRPLAELIIK